MSEINEDIKEDIEFCEKMSAESYNDGNFYASDAWADMIPMLKRGMDFQEAKRLAFMW